MFFELLALYRKEKTPLISLLQLLHSWAIRFNESYILEQVLLTPYPRELKDYQQELS